MLEVGTCLAWCLKWFCHVIEHGCVSVFLTRLARLPAADQIFEYLLDIFDLSTTPQHYNVNPDISTS